MNGLNTKFLSKNLFVQATECPTKIFYASNPAYVDKTEENEFYLALQEGGFQVEELARLYHPNGHNLHIPDRTRAIEETERILLQASDITLYEASVVYNNCFARIDILIKEGNKLDLIEVKSKSIDSTDYSFLTKKGFIRSNWKRYLYDVAFQTYVLSRAYPQFTVTPYLMLADTSKPATIDGLNQLIKINRDEHNRILITHAIPNIKKEDLGEAILMKIPVQKFVDLIWKGKDIDQSKKSEEELKDFFQRIQEYSAYCTENKRYPITIGVKCKNCEYRVPISNLHSNERSGFVECWKDVLNWKEEQFSKPHLFDLWNFRKTQALIDEGIYFLEEINFDSVKLNPRQKLQIQQTVFNPEQKEYINAKISERLQKFNYPLHFIDFETTRVALPFNKGRKPYELIAFQFSIHSLKKDGELNHSAEWINEGTGVFPNYEFVRQLKKSLSQDNGTIFRYSHYENTVLNTIYDQLDKDKETTPDAIELMEWIRSITEWKEDNVKNYGNRNMVDMLDLVKSYYYHPLMKGSNSIKEVLRSVVNASGFLKQKYTQPYYGTNFPEGIIWIKEDETSDHYKNPYTLLPPIGEDIIEIKEGGAAMTAYGKLQFTDISEQERKEIVNGLLRYCELDTLAMAMIYEHWMNN
ncbi:hypothetical protein CEE45_12315 [Candidatus Heimdallarchaeota archaeon B3_Heim]|nr:MAG: hypothetical protein CEE45_12315 [Candidatus Heimdallarchaeota archaeon B3_Heim]